MIPSTSSFWPDLTWFWTAGRHWMRRERLSALQTTPHHLPGHLGKPAFECQTTAATATSRTELQCVTVPSLLFLPSMNQQNSQYLLLHHLIYSIMFNACSPHPIEIQSHVSHFRSHDHLCTYPVCTTLCPPIAVSLHTVRVPVHHYPSPGALLPRSCCIQYAHTSTCCDTDSLIFFDLYIYSTL